jgi:hypothetical protein
LTNDNNDVTEMLSEDGGGIAFFRLNVPAASYSLRLHSTHDIGGDALNMDKVS